MGGPCHIGISQPQSIVLKIINGMLPAKPQCRTNYEQKPS